MLPDTSKPGCLWFLEWSSQCLEHIIISKFVELRLHALFQYWVVSKYERELEVLMKNWVCHIECVWNRSSGHAQIQNSGTWMFQPQTRPRSCCIRRNYMKPSHPNTCKSKFPYLWHVWEEILSWKISNVNMSEKSFKLKTFHKISNLGNSIMFSMYPS